MSIKSRPKQAHKQREEEEFLLIEGIANSQSQNASNCKKAKSTQDGRCETFGSYVCETLQKLELVTMSIAQHCMNNILFEAQMGTLNQNTTPSMLPPTVAIRSWPTTITIATSTANNTILQPTTPNDDTTHTACVPL